NFLIAEYEKHTRYALLHTSETPAQRLLRRQFLNLPSAAAGKLAVQFSLVSTKDARTQPQSVLWDVVWNDAKKTGRSDELRIAIADVSPRNLKQP
nr:hypothetical protein [Armatimonadota bacterium]